MWIYVNNYNTDVIDGEECLYPCEGTSATMLDASNYGYEMYWELIDSTGLIMAFADEYATGDVAEIPLCLELETITIQVWIHGDGWNGSTYSFQLSVEKIRLHSLI